MENNISLNMNNGRAFELLRSWLEPYAKNKHLKFDFTRKLDMGNGYESPNTKKKTLLQNENKDLHTIYIGIDPHSTSIFSRSKLMSDYDFIKISITAFHELAHFDQETSDNASKEILTSLLSKCYNWKYYRANWEKFPHEINAEYKGVMTVWNRLQDLCEERFQGEDAKEKGRQMADQLMLDYLTNKAENFVYIFEVPEGGLQSKEQVEALFEEAYNKSLNEKRDLPQNFLRMEGDVAKLFQSDEENKYLDYNPFYMQLMNAKTGRELDLKMASLVSYLHPELQDVHSKLDFNELDPKLIFGIPMPETPDELKKRLKLKTYDSNGTDSFSESIAYLTRLNDKEQTGGYDL